MNHRWRRTVVLVGLALGSTAAVVLVIDGAAHNLALLSRLRDAAPGWLVICAIGETLAYGGFVLSYQAMARISGGPLLPAGLVVRVVGLSFGAFSVATAIGGLSVDFWALREAGESPRSASSRVIALETLRWAVLSLAACVAGILVLAGVDHRMVWVVPVAWLVMTAACFAGGLWVSTPRRRAAFASRGGQIGRLLGIAVGALVYIRELIADATGLRRRGVAGAALFWAGELLCAWAALRAFGAEVGPVALLLGYATGYLASGLPLPVGGAGSVDAALTGGFALAGAPLSSALLGALAFRLFSFWLPALGALASVLTARDLPGRLRAIARARAGSPVIGDPKDPPASGHRPPG